MESAEAQVVEWASNEEFVSFLHTDEASYQMHFETFGEVVSEVEAEQAEGGEGDRKEAVDGEGEEVVVSEKKEEGQTSSRHRFVVLFEQSWTPMFVMSEAAPLSLWIERVNTFVQRQTHVTLVMLLKELHTSLRVFWKPEEVPEKKVSFAGTTPRSQIPTPSGYVSPFATEGDDDSSASNSTPSSPSTGIPSPFSTTNLEAQLKAATTGASYSFANVREDSIKKEINDWIAAHPATQLEFLGLEPHHGFKTAHKLSFKLTFSVGSEAQAEEKEENVDEEVIPFLAPSPSPSTSTPANVTVKGEFDVSTTTAVLKPTPATVASESENVNEAREDDGGGDVIGVPSPPPTSSTPTPSTSPGPSLPTPAVPTSPFALSIEFALMLNSRWNLIAIQSTDELISQVVEEVTDFLEKMRPSVTSFFDDFLELLEGSSALASGSPDELKASLLQLFLNANKTTEYARVIPVATDWEEIIFPAIRAYMTLDDMDQWQIDEWIRRIRVEYNKSSGEYNDVCQYIIHNIFHGDLPPHSIRRFFPAPMPFHRRLAVNSNWKYPANATYKAKDALREELRLMESLDASGHGFVAAPIRNNLFHWEVRFTDIDTSHPLGQDLLNYTLATAGDDTSIFGPNGKIVPLHIVFEIRLPANYPSGSPLFRLISPRFVNDESLFSFSSDSVQSETTPSLSSGSPPSSSTFDPETSSSPSPTP
eukprot:TRINITY_DN3277_c0_g1_i1.p1 TRINITY_DN3277_c0_g1~~TRINITY_DN3277_c0_g1_i1.p1  ORF type:complete len:723 (+),score=187.67 TRINITY_DN3277_c0_g1_i1:58-2169(+)